MASTRSKKTKGCGSCNFDSKNPRSLSSNTKVVKLNEGFEDALKLKAAVDECVMRLNQYNRASSAGRKAVMEMLVYFGKKRIQVLGNKP